MPHMHINLYNQFTDILNEKYKSYPVHINSQKKLQGLSAIKRTLMAGFNGRLRIKRPFPEYTAWKSC